MPTVHVLTQGPRSDGGKMLEQETTQEPAMLLTEDDLAQHLREGGELAVADDDAALQLG
jgi:hypothetical protein